AVLTKHISLLPNLTFKSIDKKYSFIVAKQYDVLDFDKSKFIYFSGTKDIMDVKQYVFKTNVLKDDWFCFKVKNLDYSPVFVTEKFVDLYKQNKWCGYDFKLVFEG
ncbi:MAG: hypothetical protein II707_02830, partial [Spirochaetales bacterium]|nr:hypothetical protein [Spirochaetales bacterium]